MSAQQNQLHKVTEDEYIKFQKEYKQDDVSTTTQASWIVHRRHAEGSHLLLAKYHIFAF